MFRRVIPLLMCAALALAGCSAGPDNGGEGTGEPSPTTATTAASSPTGEPAPTESPGTDASPADPSPTAGSTPPTPTPAPPTSGDLSGEVFPTRVAGFTVTPAEAAEGEFHPNDTPYYALDPRQSSTEAVRVCSMDSTGSFTAPVDALGAYYVDSAGAPGRALVFRFATESDAATYFDLLTSEATTCAEAADPNLLVDDLTVDEHRMSNRVTFPGPDKWSEVVVREVDRVGLLILNDAHSTAFAEMFVLADTIGN